MLVSATFIEDIKLNPHLDSVFKFFKIIVLSETISESEIDAFSYVLRKSKSVIFRKVETNASTEVRAKYNKAGTKDWISSLSSIEEIRDKFNITRHVNVIPENSGIQYMNPLQKEVNKGIHFSGREKKFSMNYIVQEIKLLQGRKCVNLFGRLMELQNLIYLLYHLL